MSQRSHRWWKTALPLRPRAQKWNGRRLWLEAMEQRVVPSTDMLLAAGLGTPPYLADLTGDATPPGNSPLDSVILNSSGYILFRSGLAGTENQFASPEVVN